MNRLSAAFVALVAFAAPAAAQFGASGEFQVNTYTTYSQSLPSVASDGEGDFVTVWESYQDGSGSGIFGRLYSRTGTAIGTEFQVNTYTTAGQYEPGVAADADGDFVVVWESYQDGDSGGIFGQRFTSAGAANGTEFQVNSYTGGSQRERDVSASPGGDFVVVWEGCGTGYDQDGDGCGIFGQRFGSAGTANGAEFQINTYTTGAQVDPAVGTAADGRFVVSWTNYGYMTGGDGDSAATFARRFSSTGAGEGADFQVNTYTTGSQGYPDVAVEPDGDFVLAWMNGGLGSNNHDGDGHGIFSQRYASDGSVRGIEFQVNSYTTGDQRYPSLGVNPDGSFVVAWASRTSYPGSQDGDSDGIFSQRFGSAGTPIGGELQINTYTTSNQRSVSVSTGGGQFVIAWRSGGQDGASNGIFAQRYSLCPAQPLAGCKTAAKSLLKFKNNTDDAKDKFLWKWIKGAATDKSEFGDPLAGTAEALCIWDATSLVMAARIPGGGTCDGNPCWKSLTSGFKYKDKMAASDGVFKALYKASADPKAKILIKGKGANAPDPLPLTVPITVQAVNSATGACWTSTFTTADSSPESFKAKSP